MRLRYALAGVFLLLLGQVELAGRASITLVDDVYSAAPVNDNTISVTGVQSGDVVAVIAGIAATTNTLTVSDNSGHTWSGCPAGNIDHVTSTLVRVVARYTTATSSMSTITLTSSVSAATYGSAVVYRGMGTVTCDATATDTNDDDEQSHGESLTVSPSTTNDTVIFGGIALTPTGTFSATPSGYTEVGTTLDRFWSGHKVVNSTSANTFAATSSGVRDSIGVLMAIKSSAGGASPSLRKLLLMGIGS